VITRFPAEELLRGAALHRRRGLPAVRETQSHLNNDRFADAVVESARFEGANAD